MMRNPQGNEDPAQPKTNKYNYLKKKKRKEIMPRHLTHPSTSFPNGNNISQNYNKITTRTLTLMMTTAKYQSEPDFPSLTCTYLFALTFAYV